MQSLGIIVIGGAGSGSLRVDDGRGKGRPVLAEIPGNSFDGGELSKSTGLGNRKING
jgi:hypothetical protein